MSFKANYFPKFHPALLAAFALCACRPNSSSITEPRPASDEANAIVPVPVPPTESTETVEDKTDADSPLTYNYLKLPDKPFDFTPVKNDTRYVVYATKGFDYIPDRFDETEPWYNVVAHGMIVDPNNKDAAFEPDKEDRVYKLPDEWDAFYKAAKAEVSSTMSSSRLSSLKQWVDSDRSMGKLIPRTIHPPEHDWGSLEFTRIPAVIFTSLAFTGSDIRDTREMAAENPDYSLYEFLEKGWPPKSPQGIQTESKSPDEYRLKDGYRIINSEKWLIEQVIWFQSDRYPTGAWVLSLARDFGNGYNSMSIIVLEPTKPGGMFPIADLKFYKEYSDLGE